VKFDTVKTLLHLRKQIKFFFSFFFFLSKIVFTLDEILHRRDLENAIAQVS